MSQHTPVNTEQPFLTKKRVWVGAFTGLTALSLLLGWGYLNLSNETPLKGQDKKPSLLFNRTMLSKGHSHLHHTMKLGQPLNLKIEGASPQANGQEFKLTGVVVSTKKVERLKLQWTLPAGVALVSGDLEQEILDLNPGEERRFHIDLRSETDTNQQVHLKAEYKIGTTSIGAVAQYNTKDGENIKRATQKLFERQKSYRHNM